MTELSLELSNVSKAFGDNRAVEGLSFSVPRASVVALLGPNGAGKTTTIEMCEGFIRPTTGSISILGMDPTRQADEVRRRIGIMLQGGGAYPGIRVGEMVNLVANYAANPLDPTWLLEVVGLEKHRKTNYRRLSGGQQQRLSLACALVGRPELVVLDEPTAGMDAQSRLAVWGLVERLRADGVTVVLTTHLMDEAEALADHVVIIDHGRLVAEGSPAELTQHTGTAAVTFETAARIDVDTLGVPVEATRPLHYKARIAPTPDAIAELTAALARQNAQLTSLSLHNRSLEDAFLELTGREMRS